MTRLPKRMDGWPAFRRRVAAGRCGRGQLAVVTDFRYDIEGAYHEVTRFARLLNVSGSLEAGECIHTGHVPMAKLLDYSAALLPPVFAEVAVPQITRKEKEQLFRWMLRENPVLFYQQWLQVFSSTQLCEMASPGDRIPFEYTYDSQDAGCLWLVCPEEGRWLLIDSQEHLIAEIEEPWHAAVSWSEQEDSWFIENAGWVDFDPQNLEVYTSG